MHWAAQYIGIKFRYGGQTLETGFDCWGLFRYVQKRHFSRQLAEIKLIEYQPQAIENEFNTNPELGNWYQVDEPENGDGVLMSTAKCPKHVGVWISDGETVGILHAVDGYGVIFTSRQNLMRSGWKILNYYRYKK